jgi:hypothetical protein
MRYRDFYDIPRAIVVEWHGRLYLFDCLYDYDADDYESAYTVYRLPDDIRAQLDEMSWTDLGHRGEKVGSIETAHVEFDKTKRKGLDPAVFDQLGLP